MVTVIENNNNNQGVDLDDDNSKKIIILRLSDIKIKFHFLIRGCNKFLRIF